MARGRMIAATVADDKRFNALPVDAALVYLMAIPQLDRDGLILGETGALWGQVCRRRNDLMPRMDAIIAAWLASGLVMAYKNEDGDTILHFVGFQKNQAMTHYDREAASRFPCPPGYIRTPKGLTPDEQKQENKTPVDQVRINSGPNPDELPPNVIQSNVNQCNVNQSNTNVAPDGVPLAPVPLAEQFHSLLAELKTTSNKPAKLREIFELCFGKDDAPDFSYLGKVAKQVGGAGRLAELFWQYSAKPPTGDILAYIVKAHTQKGSDKEGTGAINRKSDSSRNGYVSEAEAEYELAQQYR